jgi:ketosteroid isomerase-like protein
MSSENIAVINHIYEAFESRDFITFFNFLSPYVQVTDCSEVPWGGIFHGIEEAEIFFGKRNTYLDDHVAIDHLIVDGNNRIVVVGRGQGTIRETGRSFDVPMMHLWEFQYGLAVRLEIILDVPTMQAALAP